MIPTLSVMLMENFTPSLVVLECLGIFPSLSISALITSPRLDGGQSGLTAAMENINPSMISVKSVTYKYYAFYNILRVIILPSFAK